MDRDYHSKKKILDELTGRTQNPEIQPYPAMRKDLEKMAASLKAFGENNADLHKIEQDFDKISRGKTRLRSDKPEYTLFEKIRKDYQKRTKQARRLSGQYRQASSHFSALIQKHGIGRAETQKVYRKLKQVSQKLKQQIENNENQISRFEEEQNPRLEDQARLNEMKSILSQLKEEAKQLQSKETLFDRTYLKKKFIWNGPGIPDFQHFANIKLKKAQSLINHYNRKARELKK
jgi:chromosome segregation ATPase